MVKECRSNFGVEIDGFFLIPKRYFNDLQKFLTRCKEKGYVLQFRTNTFEINDGYSNLNYIREYHNKKTLVNKANKLYDKKYELHISMDYGQGEYTEKLSLLDWLIIDRIRWVSLTGFTFERRAGTLKHLKHDLANEVIVQRKLLNALKSTFGLVHSSSDLRDSFLEFLKRSYRCQH